MSLSPAISSDRAGPQSYSGHALVAALLATAILFAVEAMGGFSGATNSNGDNDSLLRMVEVRDLMGGQGWFDLTQYRLGLDGGTVIHWSRLIDAPIAAIIWFAAKLTGSAATGEMAALVLWPLLWFTIALFFLVRAAESLGGAAATLPATVIAGVCLYSLGIFAPGMIDHHNVQFALTAATLSLLLDAEKRPRRAFAAGVTSGLSIAIGMETAPYVAATGIAVAAIYLVQGERAARMASNFGAGFALTGLVVLAGTIAPSQWGAPACDAYSVVQFAAMAVGGLGLAAAASIVSWRATPMRRAAALCLAGLAISAMMIVFFPQCLAAPYSDLDPRQKIYWLDGIREAQSAWATFLFDPAAAAGRLATPFLALAVMALTAWRKGARFGDMLVGIPLLAATLVSLWQIRGGNFAAGMATIPLAAWVATWRQEGDKAPLSSQLKMLAAWVLSVNLTWGGLAMAMSKAGGRVDPTATIATAAENCTDAASYAILKTLPAATVLSGINQGAPILNFTHHRVVAAPYHRNLGNLVAYEAFVGDAAKAQQVLVDSGVSLVAICRAVDENPDASPDTVHGQLMRGDPPAWLHMVPTSKGGAIEIYQVMPTTG